MIRRMTWNCNPESLGDVSQEAFVDAFDNEVHADPRFRECDVTVTFNQALHSAIESLAVDGDDCPDFEPWQDTVGRMMQAAWEGDYPLHSPAENPVRTDRKLFSENRQNN